MDKFFRMFCRLYPGSQQCPFHLLEKAGGVCLGRCHGITIVSFFLFGLTMIPIPGSVSNRIDQSPLVPSARVNVPLVYDSIAPQVVPDTRPFVEQMKRYLALPTRTNSISLNSNNSSMQMLRDLFPDSR